MRGGLVSRQDDRLPPVTTSSLAALRNFAKAEEAISRNHYQAAAVLLESALREDPDFALAHMRVAHALTNDPNAPSLKSVIDAHRERALALANTVTDKERLRIVATYHMRPTGVDKAMAAWEALVRLDPDDWDARTNLAGLYLRVRRIPEGLREMEAVARLRPHDFRAAAWTALTWTQGAGDPDRARPHVERARKLWPSQPSGFSSETGLANLPPGYAREVAWVLLFDAYDKWRAGDIAGMLLEVQRVLDSDPLPTPADRDALLTVAMGMQMTAGRLHDARSLSGRVFQERLRNLHLAVIADAVDDFAKLRDHMSQVPVEGEGRPPFASSAPDSTLRPKTQWAAIRAPRAFSKPAAESRASTRKHRVRDRSVAPKYRSEFHPIRCRIGPGGRIPGRRARAHEQKR